MMRHNFLGLLFSTLLAGCSSSAYQRSNHFDGERFFNPGSSGNKSFLQVIKWKLTSTVTPWPLTLENTSQPNIANSLQKDEISTTFINHATHLIQLKGMNALTDPVFSERVSPFTWLGPKRVRRPGIELNALPHIDVVLISHNHFDHMDAQSILELTKKFNPLFVVPLGNESFLKEMGAKRIAELDWWQSLDLPGENHLTLVPAQHWSRRALFDMNKSLWGGYVIKTPGQRQIYFAGDTGYGSFFKDIKKKLGPMDLSILPIGSYEPRWFMQEHHMNPEEAVQAHLDLESRFSLGTHFGTFQLTDEGIDEPIKALGRALLKMKVDALKFVAPSVGETHFLTSQK